MKKSTLTAIVWFIAITLLLIAFNIPAHSAIPDRHTPRRGTIFWEDVPAGQAVRDNPYYVRDDDGDILEIHVQPANSTANNLLLHQIAESTKVYEGVKVFVYPGIARIDSAITFSSYTQWIGVPGGDDAGNPGRPVIRLFGDTGSPATTHQSAFKPDTSYLNRTGTLAPDNGYISGVVIKGLDIDIATNTGTRKLSSTVPQIGIDFRGVSDSEISDCYINNYLYGIVVSANYCDQIFYDNDNDWSTKAWVNRIYGNTIVNTGWTSIWSTGGQDTLTAYGGAGIVLIQANNALVYNNDIGYRYGPKLFWASGESYVYANDFESSQASDTTAPYVVIGFWDEAEGQAGFGAYDSSHALVQSDSLTCPYYNWNGPGTNTNYYIPGPSGSFTGNRFEQGEAQHWYNLYIGSNTRRVTVDQNHFSYNSQISGGPPLKFSTYRISVMKNTSPEARCILNTWPQDGPSALGSDRSFVLGDKAIWHALQSQPNGGVVNMPEGTYYIDFSADIIGDSLEVPSNITLKGVPGKTIFKIAGDINSSSWADSTGMLFIPPGAENITIRDIIFDGNAVEQDSSVATGQWDNSSDWQYRHIGIVVGSNSSSLSGNAQRVLIENCVFQDLTCGVWVWAKDDSVRGIRVLDNEFIPTTFFDTSHGTPNPTVSAWTVGDQVSGTGELVGSIWRGNIVYDNGVFNPANTPVNLIDMTANVKHAGGSLTFHTWVSENIILDLTGAGADTSFSTTTFAD